MTPYNLNVPLTPDNWPRRRAPNLRPEEWALLGLADMVTYPVDIIGGVWMICLRGSSFIHVHTPPFPNLAEIQACCARLAERRK